MIGLSDREARVFNLMNGHSIIRTKDLVDSTGFSEREIRRLIPRIAEKGFLTITGRMPWRYEVNVPPHERLLAEAAECFGVDRIAIVGRGHCGRAAKARQQIVIRLIDRYRWTSGQAAEAINRAPTYIQSVSARFRRAA